MAVLFPVLQFFDNNSNPLSSGFVYTYVSGTDTPQNAYTNQGGGTPLEWPIQLNAFGRPNTSGSIWLEGLYRIVITDVNGNTIGNAYDNYAGYDPVQFAALTATTSQI